MSAEFPIITRYQVVGAEDVIRTNAELWQSFKAGGINVKEFSSALRENMEGTKAMNQAYRGMRTSLRVEYAAMLEFGHLLRNIGSIGQSIVSMWQAYTLGQDRVERAQRDVSDATKDVAHWQQIYTQYLRDFGPEASVTKDALDNLNNATNNLRDANEKAAKAQNDLNMGYVGMALQTAGVVSSSIDMILHFKLLQQTMKETGGVVATLKADLAALQAIGLAGGIMIPVIIAVSWSYEDWQHKQLATPPEGLTPEELAYYNTVPDIVKQQMHIGERFGLFGGGGGSVDFFKKFLIPTGQFGIPFTKEGLIYAHEGEKLLSRPEAKQYKEGGGLVNAHVTMYNTITKEADANRAADVAYKRLLTQLSNKRG